MLKSDYENYENALKVSGIQSLEEIRDMMSLKFAKNSNFAKLFPKNVLDHRMTKRNTFKYVV